MDAACGAERRALEEREDAEIAACHMHQGRREVAKAGGGWGAGPRRPAHDLPWRNSEAGHGVRS